jgi:hypothetical protein
MTRIVGGGAYLAIAGISAFLLLFMVFNWRSLYALLFEREQRKIPIADSLSGLISRIKITFLYFTGASTSDISGKCSNYLSALTIQETYFARHVLRCAWQLFSYYMLYCCLLVFVARPIDMNRSHQAGHLVSFIISRDVLAQVLNLSLLSFTNVATDLMSLAITFVLLNKMLDAFRRKHFTSAIAISIVDLALSFLLFALSQIVSNILYPHAIENAPANYTPWSVDSAFLPYAFVKSMNGDNSTFYDFIFPGQLFITGTVFIPTLITMLVVILFLLMAAAGHYIKRLQQLIFGEDVVSSQLGPIPVTGAPNPAVLRSARCFQFAVNFMLTTAGGITATVLGTAITHLFGRP